MIREFLINSSPQENLNLIRSINHNNIDLYSGNYSVEEVCRRIIMHLKDLGKYERRTYDSWIIGGGGFQSLNLDDESGWILLKGDVQDRYIHIHPSKFGSKSIRFRGSTLKTVYKLISDSETPAGKLYLGQVNEARVQIGLSPVKKISAGKGIAKCWELFSR